VVVFWIENAIVPQGQFTFSAFGIGPRFNVAHRQIMELAVGHRIEVASRDYDSLRMLLVSAAFRRGS
jgi:hypothetical protein